MSTRSRRVFLFSGEMKSKDKLSLRGVFKRRSNLVGFSSTCRGLLLRQLADRNDIEVLKEKCGVVAVYSSSNHAAAYVRQALSSLQHRGQESTGISVYTPSGKILTYKNMGLVPHVLTADKLKKLGKSRSAIGHNRYGTSGNSSVENAQPLEAKLGKYSLSLGHNGNIPDISAIRRKLKGKKATSDTALMVALLAQERSSYSSWEETFSQILPQFKGAYTLSILTNEGSLFGIRDAYGIRPLCLGRLHDGWIIASESVAIDITGAEFVRDIMPGEIVKIDLSGNISSTFFGEPKKSKYCLFEYIYFARPDSFINGRRVRTGREISGKLLAERIKKKKIKADLIVPTFDSGYPAAKGVAEALSLPMVDAITTSHYVGRTFIQPGQENRVKAVNGKHNIVPDDIVGKSVVVVDDSAIRLTTSRILAKEIREAGAAKVYLGFASPPVVNQCDMGIDMRSKKDLPASQFEKKPFDVIEEKVAGLIGADGVVYLPIEETTKAMGGVPNDFYYYPFGGPHPIRGKQAVFTKMKRKISNKPRLCVLISGNGSNLQEIIDSVEARDIDAEISCVISNNKNAFGISRATKHNIPTKITSYDGKLSDKRTRNLYEEKLVKEIEQYNPDLIILSGWMLVLGDSFLKSMQDKEIPVINLHPALLTQDSEDEIATSRGKIPVLRGIHTINDAFNQSLQVSGVTVHQVIPSGNFDVGPVILRAEVRRRHDDTIESWEKRIHEAEYLFLPTAIKRVLHVMKNGIDISKGDFPW